MSGLPVRFYGTKLVALLLNPSENWLRRFPQELRSEQRKTEKKVKIGACPRFPEDSHFADINFRSCCISFLFVPKHSTFLLTQPSIVISFRTDILVTQNRHELWIFKVMSDDSQMELQIHTNRHAISSPTLLLLLISFSLPATGLFCWHDTQHIMGFYFDNSVPLTPACQSKRTSYEILFRYCSTASAIAPHLGMQGHLQRRACPR
jgi:hypothetical protein